MTKNSIGVSEGKILTDATISIQHRGYEEMRTQMRRSI